MAIVSTLGCLAVFASRLDVAVSQGVANEAVAYDCKAELWDWEHLWTPDWKAWCCKHEQKGCPTTSTITATTTTVTKTTVTQSSTHTRTRTSTTMEHSCDVPCSLQDGDDEEKQTTATCSERVAWASKHLTSDQENACKAALELVVSQCKDECGFCTPIAAGCEVPVEETAPSTTPRPTRTPAAKETTSSEQEATPETEKATQAATTKAPTTAAPANPCDKKCLVKGENATCGERMRWASTHDSKDEVSPCEAAQVIVTMQCPETCGECTPAEADCDVLADRHQVMQRYAQQKVFAASDSAISMMGVLMAGAAMLSAALAVGMVRSYRRSTSRNVYLNAPVLADEELLESAVEA